MSIWLKLANDGPVVQQSTKNYRDVIDFNKTDISENQDKPYS